MNLRFQLEDNIVISWCCKSELVRDGTALISPPERVSLIDDLV